MKSCCAPKHAHPSISLLEQCFCWAFLKCTVPMVDEGTSAQRKTSRISLTSLLTGRIHICTCLLQRKKCAPKHAHPSISLLEQCFCWAFLKCTVPMVDEGTSTQRKNSRIFLTSLLTGRMHICTFCCKEAKINKNRRIYCEFHTAKINKERRESYFASSNCSNCSAPPRFLGALMNNLNWQNSFSLWNSQ